MRRACYSACADGSDHHKCGVSLTNQPRSVVSAMQARAVELGFQDRVTYHHVRAMLLVATEFSVPMRNNCLLAVSAQMDATAMGFEANSFDVAIDKGTLDAIMSTPTAGGIATAYKMFGELLRCVHGFVVRCVTAITRLTATGCVCGVVGPQRPRPRRVVLLDHVVGAGPVPTPAW